MPGVGGGGCGERDLIPRETVWSHRAWPRPGNQEIKSFSVSFPLRPLEPREERACSNCFVPQFPYLPIKVRVLGWVPRACKNITTQTTTSPSETENTRYCTSECTVETLIRVVSVATKMWTF